MITSSWKSKSLYNVQLLGIAVPRSFDYEWLREGYRITGRIRSARMRQMQPDCSLKAEEEGRGDCFKSYKDFFTSSQKVSYIRLSVLLIHYQLLHWKSKLPSRHLDIHNSAFFLLLESLNWIWASQRSRSQLFPETAGCYGVLSLRRNSCKGWAGVDWFDRFDHWFSVGRKDQWRWGELTAFS